MPEGGGKWAGSNKLVELKKKKKIKWITSKDILHTTWNSAPCYVAAWMAGGFGDSGYIYV